MFGITTKGKANKIETSVCCCINPPCTCTLNALCSSGPLKRIEKRWKRFRKSNRVSKGVTQLLCKEQCRRIGLPKLEKVWDVGHSTGKAMISLMKKRQWIGMERVDRACVSRTMRYQLTKLVGAKFQANRRKEFVMQQAVDMPRRSFPKHTENARNLHASPSVCRGPCHRQTTAGSGNPLSWKWLETAVTDWYESAYGPCWRQSRWMG